MSRATVVLVHGGWDEPSSWGWVQRELEHAGVSSVAIDLPSCQRPDATLLDDAATVVDATAPIDGEVVLCGHSYGGAVITEAAAAADALHLVYVCAFVPDEGETVFDLIVEGQESLDQSGPPRIVFNDDATTSIAADVWRERMAGFPPEVAAHLGAHPRRNQSIASGITPITSAGWKTIPSTYLRSRGEDVLPAQAVEKMVTRCSTVREFDADHFLPWTHPTEVAAVISEIAAPHP